MPRTPRLKGKELIRLLEDKGFVVQRIRGSHHSLLHADGRYTVVRGSVGKFLSENCRIQIQTKAKPEALAGGTPTG